MFLAVLIVENNGNPCDILIKLSMPIVYEKYSYHLL